MNKTQTLHNITNEPIKQINKTNKHAHVAYFAYSANQNENAT